MLQRMLGRGVHIVTSGTPVAHQVEHVLGARGLANQRGEAGGEGGAGAGSEGGGAGSAGAGAGSEGDYRFLTTGDVEAFRALGSVFLQLPLGDVEHVTLHATEAAA
jgi:glutamate racemase